MIFKPVLTGFAGRKAICDAETLSQLHPHQDFRMSIPEKCIGSTLTNGTATAKAAEAYYRSLSVAVTYNGHGL